MDLKMPFLDGIEAGRKLKSNTATSEIPIIAFSASNIFDNLSDEETSLFAGLLSKPLIVDELFEKIALFLPHKVIQQKNIAPEPDQAFHFSFRKDINNVSQEINARLRDDFYRQWKLIHETNSMKKIIDFASGLKTFSIQQQLSGMESYAQAVIDAANGFDVEDVKKLLRQFPDILHLLKT
jgi:CheY-like chemotaxis protein